MCVCVCVCLTDVQAFLFFNQNTRVNVLNVLHFNAIKRFNYSFQITYVLAFDTSILCVSVSIQT